MLSRKKYPTLVGLMATIPAVKAEMEQLLAEKSAPSGAADRAVHQIGAVLARHGMLNGFAKLSSAPPTAQSTGSDAASFGFPIGNGRHELTRFRLLLAMAHGNYVEVCEEAAAKLDWGGKNPKCVIAGLMNQITKGTGRPRFIAEILKATGHDHHEVLLAHLSQSFNTLGYKTSPKGLENEAQAYGYTRTY